MVIMPEKFRSNSLKLNELMKLNDIGCVDIAFVKTWTRRDNAFHMLKIIALCDDFILTFRAVNQISRLIKCPFLSASEEMSDAIKHIALFKMFDFKNFNSIITSNFDIVSVFREETETGTETESINKQIETQNIKFKNVLYYL